MYIYCHEPYFIQLLSCCYYFDFNIDNTQCEYSHEIPQSHTADKTHGTARKSHRTLTVARQQKENQALSNHLSLSHQMQNKKIH